MPVRVERRGRVLTVIHSRPEARNAVDPEHAEVLNNSFLAFDRDDAFWGEGGAFCAGADLKCVSARSLWLPSSPSTWPAPVTIPVTHYMSGWRQFARRRRGSWAGHPSKRTARLALLPGHPRTGACSLHHPRIWIVARCGRIAYSRWSGAVARGLAVRLINCVRRRMGANQNPDDQQCPTTCSVMQRTDPKFCDLQRLARSS
jgi:hypothetical protein